MIRALLLAVLLLLIAWGFWRLVDGVIEVLGGTTRQRAKRQAGAAVKLVRDPVCGTWVSPRTARSLKTGSATQYFCSDDCRVKFERRS